MNEISFGEARMRAMDAIRRLAKEQNLGDLMIVDDAIVETKLAWYFPYDAADFIRQGDISAALAGNIPVKVPRDGSAITYEEPVQE